MTIARTWPGVSLRAATAFNMPRSTERVSELEAAANEAADADDRTTWLAIGCKLEDEAKAMKRTMVRRADLSLIVLCTASKAAARRMMDREEIEACKEMDEFCSEREEQRKAAVELIEASGFIDAIVSNKFTYVATRDVLDMIEALIMIRHKNPVGEARLRLITK